MEILIGFLMFSLLVLGTLCFLVLEYQNSKTRQWDQLWAQRHPIQHPPPKPILQKNPTPDRLKPLPYPQPANMASLP